MSDIFLIEVEHGGETVEVEIDQLINVVDVFNVPKPVEVIDVGSVGDSLIVVDVIYSPNPVGIVSGPKGDTGSPGPQGSTGPQGPPGVSAAASYRHVQSSPSNVWTINHNLGFYPSLTILDSGGEEVEGYIIHNNVNAVAVSFSSAFSGEAYLS